MSVPGHLPEPNVKSEFVISGLRAAAFVNSIARNKIISDVSNILNCCSEELEFLFTGLETSGSPKPNYDVMVPNFQSELLAIAE